MVIHDRRPKPKGTDVECHLCFLLKFLNPDLHVHKDQLQTQF